MAPLVTPGQLQHGDERTDESHGVLPNERDACYEPAQQDLAPQFSALRAALGPGDPP